jgi:hypothetical protein
MSRARRLGAGLGGLIVVFTTIYLLGVLPLGTTLRAGGFVAGLFCLVSVATALPLEEGEQHSEDDGAWKLPARTKRLRRIKRRIAEKVRTEAADTPTERLVRIAETSAADFDTLLRPRLTAVTLRRVRRAGYEPSDMENLEQLLGPLAGVVLQPRPRGHDPRQPGVAASEVALFLTKLKELN